MKKLGATPGVVEEWKWMGSDLIAPRHNLDRRIHVALSTSRRGRSGPASRNLRRKRTARQLPPKLPRCRPQQVEQV